MSIETYSLDNILKKYFKENEKVCITLNKIEISKNIVINNEKCISCDICVEVCPLNAIVPHNPKPPNIIVDSCVFCGRCVKKCPMNAIEIKYNVGRVENSNITIEEWIKNTKLLHNKIRCLDCLVCVKTCPFCAIKSNGYKNLDFDCEKCELCGFCGDICPIDAIKYEGIKKEGV